MSATLRALVLDALDHWGTLYKEVDPNRIVVLITPRTELERICGRSGEVTIVLTELDQVSPDDADVYSFVPGSIYLHRLVRELQAGAMTAAVEVAPLFKAPARAVIEGQASRSLGDGVTVHRVKSPEEHRSPAVAFHFVLLLRGLSFVERFLTLPVTVHERVLLDAAGPEAERQAFPDARLDSERITECYQAAVIGARQKILEELETYQEKMGAEAELTVRSIRRLLRKEIRGVRNAHGGSAAEVDEQIRIIRVNTNRTIDSVRRQGRASSVELTLVAATAEWRPLARYRLTVHLPGDRVRSTTWIFDRSSGALHPPPCEGCGSFVGRLHAGEEPCAHLLCPDCHAGPCGIHAICPRCRSTCDLCHQSVCLRCTPESRLACGHVVCEGHAVLRCTTTGCVATLCGACSRRCKRCRRPFCARHITSCPSCEASVCLHHIAHSRSCYRKWLNRRKRELLHLARSYHADNPEEELLGEDLGQAELFEGLTAQYSAAFGRSEADPALAGDLFFACLDHEINLQRLVRAWFFPLQLLPQDDQQVMQQLQRLDPLAITRFLAGMTVAEDRFPSAGFDAPWYRTFHDPRIAEYGALPAPPATDERSHRVADAWFDRLGESLPGFDPEEIRYLWGGELPERSTISPEERALRNALVDAVRIALKTLTPREELVLKMLFGIGEGAEHTKEEVGRSFFATVERIRQIESKALRKLRHPARASRLLPFVGS